jgi:pimeloyl-ACP methyl ester carboxylesterase
VETVRSADGTTIACDLDGDGPPIVLVGGAFSTRELAAPLARLLAPHRTVVRYDRRGRGGSGDTPPYDVGREVDDLAAVLDVVGPAAVYGESGGGGIGLLAAKAGVAMAGLVVYEPPFGAPEWPGLREAVRADLAADRRASAVKRFLAAAVDAPDDVLADAEQWDDWHSVAAQAPVLPYDLAVIDAVRDLTGRLDVATRVLHGSESFPWVAGAMTELARRTGAERSVLPGQHHGVEPDALVPYLKPA